MKDRSNPVHNDIYPHNLGSENGTKSLDFVLVNAHHEFHFRIIDCKTSDIKGWIYC